MWSFCIFVFRTKCPKSQICPHHCILLVQWYHVVTCKPPKSPLNTDHALLLLEASLTCTFAANLTPNSLAQMLTSLGKHMGGKKYFRDTNEGGLQRNSMEKGGMQAAKPIAPEDSMGILTSPSHP
ncbi:hypothetical protein KIL84_006572 [Mauremys mutica]|uniref:Uncharacterized protein n=1 Tax=Mauremys mutica TaxID=74926 RepID=A0A9D4AUN9_9SAUR|nr:hypothetical protein KIL84_006572 [Mauremys mutica]